MRWILRVASLAGLWAGPALAQPLTATEIAKVDAVVAEAMARSPTPSLSIAVIRDGRPAFAKAYGFRTLDPPVPADPEARYDIGSVSKQFTAAVALRLADRGALALDDKVSDHLPGLSGGETITLRQALNHTAGYNSYFMLDFLPAESERPIAPIDIARRWGRAPLDFAPGTRWDYSNTGYAVAGLVIEQASGRSLADLLAGEIFDPLAMAGAAPLDRRPLGPGDARGYTRIAVQPPRPAPQAGKGWTFGAGGLAMTASDLARWDMAVLDGRLLSAQAWSAQRRTARLTDGSDTGYGLGVYVDTARGRRRLRHDGAAYGFTAENRVYPDDGTAIVVLSNADFGHAAGEVADALERMLLPMRADAPLPETSRPPSAATIADPEAMGRFRALLGQLSDGDPDRGRLSPDLSTYLSGEVLDDYRVSLKSLGPPVTVEQLRSDEIGGLRASLYRLSWREATMIGVLRIAADGRVASFALFEP
ncbi:MAG: serine hydrolase domain-containing protein [Caulobacter sp.]